VVQLATLGGSEYLTNMTFPRFTADTGVRRLRWVVILIILVDGAFTLFGQTSSYWHDASTVSEIDPVARFFLVRGVAAYISWVLLRAVLYFVIASIVPRKVGMAILFFGLLEHFWGITSWILYHFHWSTWWQNAFESVIAVVVTFSICQTSGLPLNQSPEPNAVGVGNSAITVHVVVRRWLSFFR
jgi:hypothetical protein